MRPSDALVVFALAISGCADSAEQDVRDLLGGSQDQKAKARESLHRRGDGALPVLEECLRDERIAVSARGACARIVARIGSAAAGRVFLSILPTALRGDPRSMVGSREFRDAILGGIGRLKVRDAIPILEREFVATRSNTWHDQRLAWTLRELTGRDYGPAFDPWDVPGVKY